ncbi:hypothetical protein [Aquisalibacillus elongatus]|uniref:Uncharacterized protein n=1 Tax=Aquisalibacillus elongatus TaxID=485577 RepID=A0A3N5BCZ6_9BACI|nr:hypothetical protein [Aquisalibacillus elongatus]RPF53200.1 hypothetical protein EDC24_1697 [Aquisalibacillus elongatus]
MNNFTKWFTSSMFLALIALILVFNIEGLARLSGEMNRSFLLTGTLATFILVILSITFLFKANSERKQSKIIASFFASLIPLGVFIMNGVLFSVWFIGK